MFSQVNDSKAYFFLVSLRLLLLHLLMDWCRPKPKRDLEEGVLQLKLAFCQVVWMKKIILMGLGLHNQRA